VSLNEVSGIAAEVSIVLTDVESLLLLFPLPQAAKVAVPVIISANKIFVPFIKKIFNS
jgi:hypothetical protein